MAAKHWEEFGLFYKQLREKAGLTQEEAAKKAGIHWVQLSRIENGESGTRRETVKKLAQAIGASVDLLLERAGFKAVASERATSSDFLESDFAALYFKHNKLSPKKRAEFRRILEMVDRELDRLQEE